MNFETIGIICGLTGAMLQGLNYTITKDCLEKYGMHGLRLLFAVHLCIGFLMVPIFIFKGYFAHFDLTLTLWLTTFVMFYLAGQYGINRAFESADSSIVAPLISMKIPFLGFATVIAFGQSFSLWQVAAIAAIVSLCWYTSMLSGRLKLRPFIWIMFTCLMFTGTDTEVVYLFRHFETSLGISERFEQILFLTTISYICSAIPALPCLASRGRLKLSLADVWHAKWVGITWIVSSVLINASFNLSGIVEGNMLQSLRSMFGVLFAYLLFRSYVTEQHTFVKKTVISIALSVAVAVYFLNPA